MTLLEVPLQTLEDEITRLKELPDLNDEVVGAIMALQWLIDGDVSPSEVIRASYVAT
jgi:hypothetical protein